MDEATKAVAAGYMATEQVTEITVSFVSFLLHETYTVLTKINSLLLLSPEVTAVISLGDLSTSFCERGWSPALPGTSYGTERFARGAVGGPPVRDSSGSAGTGTAQAVPRNDRVSARVCGHK